MSDRDRKEAVANGGIVEREVGQRTDDRTIWDRYQDANQAYVVLGVTHFALFATGMAGAGLRDGNSPVASAVVGVLVGLIFLLLFFHLAEYHGEAGGGSEKLAASEAINNDN